MNQRTRTILSAALVGIGMLNITGYVIRSQPVRGLGIASVASPLPLVFTHFRGIETFAAAFSVELGLVDGERILIPVTPALYGQLAGPYNRRNTYGAVISYGPALTEPGEQKIVHSVLRYGFCNDGPLAKEFSERSGKPARLKYAVIHVDSRTQGRKEHWQLHVDCREES